MLERRLLTCSCCRARVREDRLSIHLLRVHGLGADGDKSSESTTPHQVTSASGTFLTIPCSCGGQNESCFRCGGWGYIDAIGEGRSAPADLLAGSISVTARTTKRSGGKRKNPRLPSNLPNICPQCGVAVRNLQKHLNKVHTGALPETAPVPASELPTASTLRRYPVRPEECSEFGAGESSKNERGLDATHDYYAAYRDNGQFDSHPSHDGYDGESKL